jgi:hypothetical protein
MADEVETIESASPEVVEAAETQVAGSQPEAQESDVQDAVSEQGASDDKKHPLEPGGKRFNEVVARAHKAEDERRELKEQLQREREERIRLEERQKVTEEAKAKTAQAQELSWQQLEDLIAEGKTTRAEANAYRENITQQKAIEAAEKRLAAKLDTDRRQARVQGDLDAYKREVPAILERGTPERQRVEREYQYLVEVLGHSHGLQTELAATRAALGDIDTVKQKKTAAQSARESRETFVETATSGKGISRPSTDSIKGLSQREKDFYEKEISKGRYSGWDEVKKEVDEYNAIKGIKA